jgi:hypothetical protein
LTASETPVPPQTGQDFGNQFDSMQIDPDATRQIASRDDTPSVPIEGKDILRAERVESQDSKPSQPAGIIESRAAPLAIPPSPPSTEKTESEPSDATKEPGPRIISVMMPEPETPQLLMPKKTDPADNEQEETSS